MTTKLVIGNWKMNGTKESASSLIDGIRSSAVCAQAHASGITTVCCPPFTLLSTVAAMLDGTAIAVGAQTCHAKPSGAFTGDISASMLADVGCSYVIVGHSERRKEHHEHDDMVSMQALAAMQAGLIPVVCVGETLAEYQQGRSVEVVRTQINAVAAAVESTPVAAIIAYEPVWAIGTGLAATAEHITLVHTEIARMLPTDIPILYGGSVTAGNAHEIFSCACVSGALVGGASLRVTTFEGIIQAACDIWGEIR